VPTVLGAGRYRFYFYSHEPNEPRHIHADGDDLSAKFWREPVGLGLNFGFSAVELRKGQSVVESNQARFIEASNGHFGVEG
jgi:hypothetical protein